MDSYHQASILSFKGCISNRLAAEIDGTGSKERVVEMIMLLGGKCCNPLQLRMTQINVVLSYKVLEDCCLFLFSMPEDISQAYFSDSIPGH